MKHFFSRKPSLRSAAVAGAFSGAAAIAAGLLTENVHSTIVRRFIEFVALLIVFVAPIALCVIGLEYFEVVLGKSRGNRPWSHTVAEAGLRALLWFLVAGTVLIVLGFAHMFYTR